MKHSRTFESEQRRARKLLLAMDRIAARMEQKQPGHPDYMTKLSVKSECERQIQDYLDDAGLSSLGDLNK